MPTETALEAIEQASPQPIQQIVRHTRLLTLATTGELEAAKAKIPEEDVVTHAVLTAIKMTSEGARSWIETIMADHGIGWRDAEKVKQYVEERFNSAGLRLVIQEAVDNLPETWRVESNKVHLVKENDGLGQQVMRAIKERTKEAMKESRLRTERGEESQKHKLLKELEKREYGTWAHEPVVEQIWTGYNPNGISQLIAENNKGLKERRNLKIHIRSNIAIVGAKEDVYMPDPGVEIPPINTKEIFEQALLEVMNKNIREFLREFIDSGMEIAFERAKEILGYDTEKTESFVVSINKNKFRQYGVKLVINKGVIRARRFEGEEYTKGSRILSEEWQVLFLKTCKNIRMDRNERFLRFLVRKNGTAKVNEVMEEIGFNLAELVEAVQQISEKSLEKYGFGIAIDEIKENIFVEKTRAREKALQIMIAEDRMLGITQGAPQDNTLRDLTADRPPPDLPDHYGSETLTIIKYLLTTVRTDEGKKLIELAIQNPKGVDEKEAEKLLGVGYEDLTRKIRNLNYVVLKKWGHRIARVDDKIILTKTADDEIIGQLLSRVGELEMQQAQQEAEKKAKREAAKQAQEAKKAKREAAKQARQEAKKAEHEAAKQAQQEAKKAEREEARQAQQEAKKAEHEAAKQAQQEAKKAEHEATKQAQQEAKKAEHEATKTSATGVNKQPKPTQKLTIRAGRNGGTPCEGTIDVSPDTIRKIVDKTNRLLGKIDGDREIEVVGLTGSIPLRIQTIRNVQLTLAQINGGLEEDGTRISQKSLRKLDKTIEEFRTAIEK